MSKPRLKGATIGIRLPLGSDEIARRRAEAAGVSVAVYLGDLVARALGSPSPATPWNERDVVALKPKVVRKETRSESNKRTVHPSTEMTCAHRDRSLIGGGMSRCKDCGKTRGADGVWR